MVYAFMMVNETGTIRYAVNPCMNLHHNHMSDEKGAGLFVRPYCFAYF